MRRVFPFTVLILFLLSGAGCSPAPSSVSVDDGPETAYAETTAPTNTWQILDPTVARMEWDDDATDTTVIVFRFDPKNVSLRWERNADGSFVSEWADAISDELLVVNGVYFHEDNSPSGFLETKNERVGTRAFDIDKSGLITLSPVFSIQTDYFLPPEDGVTEAAQSYPMLIANGAPAVAADSGLTARRTFLGTDKDGFLYVGIIRTDISLFALSHLLDTMPIDWKQAINLDGGPSTGMSATIDSYTELHDSFTPIPIALVISRRTGGR